MALKLSKKYSGLVLLLTLCLLSGCAAKTNTSADYRVNAEQTLVVTDLKYNEILKEEKVELVEFNFTFPQIENLENNGVYEQINQAYAKKFEEAKQRGATESLKAAKESYLLYKDDPELTFMRHGYQINYSVMTNDGKDLSIFQMYSDFTGGAHPNNYFEAQNYDITTGNPIKLSDLFGRNEAETKAIILKQVIESIKNQEAKAEVIYYESYITDCDTAYNPEHFYLKDGKLIFFYQPYDIAPYAAGLREFEIQMK